MIKRLLVVLASASLLFISNARAETSPDTDLVLLTENFPPYNMAKNGKNFAQGDNINGIATDIVREMFQRAGLTYSLTLRFPWERVYKLALENPGYGAFVMARLPDRERLFKWVGPIGPDDWILLAKADSKITLETLNDARKYKIGAYKGDAIAEKFGTPLTHEYNLLNLLSRPEIDYVGLVEVTGQGAEDPQVAEQVEIKTKYAGYIDRQQDEIARLRASEDTKLPVDIDYTNISGLSKEIQSKLGATRPETLGQASRIPGVTPAAISLLMIHLKKRGAGRQLEQSA